MLVNSTDKQAAKAALGLAVSTRGWNPEYAAAGVAAAAARLGLQLGDMGSFNALTRYAYGVAEKGERVSNRRWSEYPGVVQQLAYRLANGAAEVITSELQ